uniref:Reverse transcriptase RNase H-like domain-containing protein n=1 Tax=Trichogramma kaykai TaxID=54128 RepID=A0ABD2WVE5_9HYME
MLVWLHNLKNSTSRLAHWRERLRYYDYEIIHKSGKINLNADALSRNPCDQHEPHREDNIEREISEIFMMTSSADSEHPAEATRRDAEQTNGL